MKQYSLESESAANRVIEAMNQIVQDRGHVTVGELYDLLGVSHTFTDERNGWYSTNHVVKPTVGGVILELSDPVSIPPLRLKQQSIIRLTMEFESTPEIERRLTDFLNATDLRQDAILWSLNSRPRGPRVSYRTPYNSGDDL